MRIESLRNDDTVSQRDCVYDEERYDTDEDGGVYVDDDVDEDDDDENMEADGDGTTRFEMDEFDRSRAAAVPLVETDGYEVVGRQPSFRHPQWSLGEVEYVYPRPRKTLRPAQSGLQSG
jgi:hypothetical protein